MVSKLPLRTISCRLRFQFLATRSSHTTNAGLSQLDLATVLQQNLLNPDCDRTTQTHNTGASIYRIPDSLRSVEPKAYEPNLVSIGPYHHGAAHLQAMETTKWNFFRGIFNPSNRDRPNLNAVLNEVKHLEHRARGAYSEEVKISSNEFVQMMIIDSCFVVQVLKEIGSSNKSRLIQRWMVPVIQRDLIMLENQIPLFLVERVYQLLTNCEAEGLKELALQSFEPMIYKDLDTPKSIHGGVDRSHFLELFRASICPTDEVIQHKFPVKEPHMFRSMTELKESGVKIKKATKCQPLDVTFKKGVLKIATVSMDDYKFTLFRNMMAFEQCHFDCKPHVTAYVFFLDRLINSAEDIELLHYSGVVQHTLGGNKNAARLVNKLCKEVANVATDSYLRDVLWKINCHCNDGWNQKKARLRHEYFHNVWVSLSTVAAVIIIYFTILQTISGLPERKEGSEVSELFGVDFWVSFAHAFAIPFGGLKSPKKVPSKDKLQIIQWLFGYKEHDHMNPFFFMSC